MSPTAASPGWGGETSGVESREDWAMSRFEQIIRLTLQNRGLKISFKRAETKVPCTPSSKKSKLHTYTWSKLCVRGACKRSITIFLNWLVWVLLLVWFHSFYFRIFLYINYTWISSLIPSNKHLITVFQIRKRNEKKENE